MLVFLQLRLLLPPSAAAAAAESRCALFAAAASAAAAAAAFAAALQKGTVQVLFYSIPAEGVPGAPDGKSCLYTPTSSPPFPEAFARV